MISSSYVENLINGRCPECGKRFVDDKERPMMLVCPNKKCGYEIDTETYFEVLDEYYPPAPEDPSDDPDTNLQKLSDLEI